MINVKHFTVLAITFLSSCGQNSHMTLDKGAAATSISAPSISAPSISAPGASSTVGEFVDIEGSCETGATVTITSSGFVSPPAPFVCVSGAYDIAVVFASGGAQTVNVEQSLGGLTSDPSSVAVVVDNVDPTAVLSGAPSGSSALANVTLNLVFSELIDVGTLTASDFLVSEGSVSTFNAATHCSTVNAPAPHTECSVPMSVTATTGETVSIELNANAVSDLYGNAASPVSNSLSWIFDTTAPTLAITAPSAINSGNQSSYSVTGTCSEIGRNVSVSIGSIVVSPVPLCGAGGTWIASGVDVSGLSNGSVSITASQTDAAGNSASATPVNVTKDTNAPTISSIAATSGFTAIGSLISASTTSLSVDITFSENMASSGSGAITAADFAATNATITSVTCSTAALCTVVLNTSASTDGNIELKLETSPAAVIQDVAGNDLSGGMGSTTWTMDNIGPTVTITTTEPDDPTLSTSIPITITFSEPVTGFDSGDFSAGPGPSVNFTAVSSTVYTFTQIVSSSTSTTVSVNVSINVATDQAGNGNSSGTFSIGYGDGSSPNDYESCWAVAVDSSDNRICVGYTNSNLSETPGGGGDFFIMKTNSSGQRLWTQQGGLGTFGSALPGGDTTQNDICRAVAVDAGDNIICVGYTSGSLGEAYATGGTNGFILKLNPDGDLLWIKQIGAGSFGTSMPGGETGHSRLESVGVDLDTNNIIFAGDTNVSIGEAKFNADVIVGSLDSDGNLLWIKQGGSGSFGTDLQFQAPNAVTSENKYAPALFVDQTNNELVLLVHNYNSALNESQVSIVKMDLGGSMLWAKSLDTFSFQAGSGGWGDIEVAADSSIYLTGYFRASSEGFDRGGLIKLDSSGNQMWKKTISDNETFGSTNATTQSFGLTIDSSENIIIGGYTSASLAETISDRDVFFAKFDATGNTLGYWQAGSGAMGASKNEHTSAPGGSNQECMSLVIDSSDNLVCGGASSRYIDKVYHFGGNSDIMLMTLNTSDVSYLNDLFSAFITSPNVVCTSTSTYEVQTSVGGHCDPDFPAVITSFGTASCIGGMYTLDFIAGTGSPGDNQTFNVSAGASQGGREILSDTQSTTAPSFGACDGF